MFHSCWQNLFPLYLSLFCFRIEFEWSVACRMNCIRWFGRWSVFSVWFGVYAMSQKTGFRLWNCAVYSRCRLQCSANDSESRTKSLFIFLLLSLRFCLLLTAHCVSTVIKSEPGRCASNDFIIWYAHHVQIALVASSSSSHAILFFAFFCRSAALFALPTPGCNYLVHTDCYERIEREVQYQNPCFCFQWIKCCRALHRLGGVRIEIATIKYACVYPAISIGRHLCALVCVFFCILFHAHK